MCQLVQPEYALEMQQATLIVLLGVWLAIADTFDVSNVYTVMASIASQLVWSVIFITIGLIQIYVITFDHKWQFCVFNVTIDCQWIRKHILLIKGAMWFTLFMGVVFGDWRALSAPMYFIFAFNAFRSFFCIRCTVQKNLDKTGGL
jgi:hypothetical protein